MEGFQIISGILIGIDEYFQKKSLELVAVNCKHQDNEK